MRHRIHTLSEAGHTLFEMMAVLSVLAICMTVAGVVLSRGLGLVEARGTAQAWQSAAAAAQVASVWHGVSEDVTVDSQRLSVTAWPAAGPAGLGMSVPPADVVANVARWQREHGAAVRFVGGSGAPNAAGSLFFSAPGGEFRVAVRLESGLTTRVREDAR